MDIIKTLKNRHWNISGVIDDGKPRPELSYDVLQLQKLLQNIDPDTLAKLVFDQAMKSRHVIRIDPEGVYRHKDVVEFLGFDERQLRRAGQAGKLKYAERGRQIVYLGQWLADWLKSAAGNDARPPRPGAA